MMRRYSKLTIKRLTECGFREVRFASSGSTKAVLTRRGKTIPLEKGFFYNVTTGLHGDEMDLNPQSPTYGQLSGNQNGDFFGWEDELLVKKEHGPHQGKRTYATWEKVPVHINHDPEYTCGFVSDTFPNFREKSIEMVMCTDLSKEYDLCERIRNGQQTDVSMGCDLLFSFCSSCGNCSFNDEDWCECLSYYKGSRHPRTGRLVCEILKQVTGVELSHITEGVGADARAKNKEVLFMPELSRRSAKRKISELQSYYKQLLGIK